jgi:protein involved in polysaccharide export with SLBB domain
MRINAIARIPSNNGLRGRVPGFLPSARAVAALGLLLCILVSGCQSPNLPKIVNAPADTNNAPSLLLHEGDVLQIKFPGAPDMDAVQTIRADGRITIINGGDVKVSGLTPEGAVNAILEKVGDKIKVKQVSVTVQSSAFIVYVTGAVLKPGKLISDRPLTVLQAVIEASVDSTKSNLEKVKVMRMDADGHYTYKMLNLQHVIDGIQDEPFTLKPYDIIVVPEKFSWY